VDLKPSNGNDIIIKTTVFVLFALFFFLDYMSLALGLIPRQFTWLPEVISLGILFYIFVKMLREKELIPILGQTQLVIFFIVLTVLGLVINRVGIPVALAGIRNNLKYLPLFFLPFFHRFDKDFMRKFLVFLFILALVQLPVTVIQRIVYKIPSGDFIGGTLGARSTGILSVFLVLCLVFWSFSFIKGKLKPLVYVAGFAGLLLPIGLNETKISYFMLIAAFLCVFLFTRQKREHIRQILIVFLCLAVGLPLIIGMYNRLYVQEPTKEQIDKKQEVVQKDLSEEMAGKQEQKSLSPDKQQVQKAPSLPDASQKENKKPLKTKIERYFDPRLILYIIHRREIRKSGALNRIPQVIFAFNHIKKNPARLLLGVGAGNASDSFFEKARGEYHKEFGDLDIGNNLLSRMLWEYGLIGTFLFFSIFVYFFIKAWGLRKSDDIIGVTASGYLVLIVVFCITSIYFNTMLINLSGYLFWFLGGYMLAYGYHLKALKETNK